MEISIVVKCSNKAAGGSPFAPTVYPERQEVYPVSEEKNWIFVWVCFDLGVNGDYQGMYRWLDSQKAQECGDGIGCFWYSRKGDVLQDIKKDISENVKIGPANRVYVIRLKDDKPIGNFIFGNRRSAPWAGYAGTGETVADGSQLS